MRIHEKKPRTLSLKKGFIRKMSEFNSKRNIRMNSDFKFRCTEKKKVRLLELKTEFMRK